MGVIYFRGFHWDTTCLQQSQTLPRSVNPSLIQNCLGLDCAACICKKNRTKSITPEWFWNAIEPLTLVAYDNPLDCNRNLCWLDNCSLAKDLGMIHHKCGYWVLPLPGLECASPLKWKGQQIATTGNRPIHSPTLTSTIPMYVLNWFEPLLIMIMYFRLA